jgi:hypothetical protein
MDAPVHPEPSPCTLIVFNIKKLFKLPNKKGKLFAGIK